MGAWHPDQLSNGGQLGPVRAEQGARVQHRQSPLHRRVDMASSAPEAQQRTHWSSHSSGRGQAPSRAQKCAAVPCRFRKSSSGTTRGSHISPATVVRYSNRDRRQIGGAQDDRLARKRHCNGGPQGAPHDGLKEARPAPGMLEQNPVRLYPRAETCLVDVSVTNTDAILPVFPVPSRWIFRILLQRVQPAVTDNTGSQKRGNSLLRYLRRGIWPFRFKRKESREGNPPLFACFSQCY